MSRYIQYAIGDVHGMLDCLLALHAHIRNDLTENGARGRIIHLGDYIDRGPSSYEVIETLMAMQAATRDDLEIVCLRGNHEQLLLDALQDPRGDRFRSWMFNGGDETLESYLNAHSGDQLREWQDAFPSAHRYWLNTLPTMLHDAERGLVFVHAGIDPDAFPQCADAVRIWTRSDAFFDVDRWPARAQLEGLCVVHGHTPNERLQPEIHPHRINVDTGCVYGGTLSAVALETGRPPRILAV